MKETSISYSAASYLGLGRLNVSSNRGKGLLMRMIMHDYADTVCIEILSPLTHEMSLDLRVLVCDMVLPQRVGEADFPAAVLDQAVMTIGGKRGLKQDLEAF